MMILSQRGNDAFDNTQNLLMSMMMAGSGALGDRSLTSNPLLVMALLDNNDEKVAFDLLLKMSLLGGDDSSGRLVSSPLLLTSLLGENVDRTAITKLMLAQASEPNSRQIEPLLLMSLLENEQAVNPLRLMHINDGTIDPLSMLLMSGDKTASSDDGDREAKNLDLLLLVAAAKGQESDLPRHLLYAGLLQDGTDSFDDVLPLVMMNDDSEFAQSANPVLLQAYMNGDSSEDLVLPLLISSGAFGGKKKQFYLYSCIPQTKYLLF